MTDLSISLLSGALGMMALTIVSLIALRGWGQWLSLRRVEIEACNSAGQSREGDSTAATGSRIEMADLRERVRKLEAIAAGVDL